MSTAVVNLVKCALCPARILFFRSAPEFPVFSPVSLILQSAGWLGGPNVVNQGDCINSGRLAGTHIPDPGAIQGTKGHTEHEVVY